MKATVEIADDLFERAERLAKENKTSLGALAEEGLRLVLSAKESTRSSWSWKPVTCGGEGITEELQAAGWEAIRDEAYRGAGA